MGTGTQSGGGASGVELEGDVDDEVDDEDEDEEGDEEQKKKKQKKRQAFQLKTMDLPKDIKGIKVRFFVHNKSYSSPSIGCLNASHPNSLASSV
jgi:hypothetical protein